MRWIHVTTAAVLLGIALSAPPARAGDLGAAIRVANAVYPTVPQRCGTVKVEVGTLSSPNLLRGIAEADEPACRVRIKPGILTNYSNAGVCSLLTHEWGHLAGRRFPENPADPYHSPNPHNNMYAYLVHHPACGESDDASAARQAREAVEANRRAERLSVISDEISDLKDRIRVAKAAMRHTRGANRRRRARRIRRLRSKIARLRVEYRSLARPFDPTP